MTEVLHGLPADGIVARNVRHSDETWQQRRLDDLAGSDGETVTGASIDLWFADLAVWSSINPHTLAELSPDEHERAARIPDVESRQDWQRSRALLRRILSRYLPAQTRLDIEPGAHGKPRLRTQDPHSLYFNLSHHRRRETSSGWILAISRAGEVGIDLEAVRAVPNASRLAQRVFSAAEREYLEIVSIDSAMQRDQVFLDIWTRKEALLKAIGDGFTRPANALHVGPSADSPHRAPLQVEVRAAGAYELVSLRSPGDHLVAVAAAFEPTRLRLTWLAP